MHQKFDLIHTSWQQSSAALNAVRRSVFIEEQHVPEALEWDGLDASCHHVLVTAAGYGPVGAGRTVDPNPKRKRGKTPGPFGSLAYASG